MVAVLVAQGLFSAPASAQEDGAESGPVTQPAAPVTEAPPATEPAPTTTSPIAESPATTAVVVETPATQPPGDPAVPDSPVETVPPSDGEENDPADDSQEAPAEDGGAPRYSFAELLAFQELYDEAVGDEAEALARFELARTRVEQIDARIARSLGMLRWTELEIESSRREVVAAEDARRASEQELERVSEELAAERLRLKRQAVEAFIGGSGTNEDLLTTILQSESIDEVESVRAYAEVALVDQDQIIDGIEHLEVRVDELVARNEGLERATRRAHVRVASFETEVKARRAELDGLREGAVAEKAELQTQLADIQTRRTEYEQRLNALEQDSDSASAALQRAQAGQVSGPPPRLHPPLLESSISSGFGPRLHPIFHNVRMHNGLDYGGSSGDEIYAAAAGVVVMSEARGGYGNVVVIDHGGQWGTLYAHQSRLLVVPGQQVARGEVVGWVGSTGYSTGPHLHFELRQFGDPRNPFNHIDFEELHPVECVVLIQSEHPNDLAAAQQRDDCAEYFEDDDQDEGQ